jgi:hypothetical protein
VSALRHGRRRYLRGEERRKLVTTLQKRLPELESTWRRGRALRVAALALRREYELFEAVVGMMRVVEAEQSVGGREGHVAFRVGLNLDGGDWRRAWPLICELSGISEAVACEVLGESFSTTSRVRRRNSQRLGERIAKLADAVSDRELRELHRILTPDPTPAEALDLLIAGELVIERDQP